MAYISNPIDTGTTAVIVYDENEHWSQVGQNFLACYTTGGLSNGATANMLMTTPNTNQTAHVTFEYGVNTEAIFRVYEGVTTATTGSAILTPNLLRLAANSASATVKVTASASNFGTVIFEDRVGFSGGGAASPAGGNGSFAQALLLKQNTNYMFFVSAFGAGSVSMHLFWHEL